MDSGLSEASLIRDVPTEPQAGTSRSYSIYLLIFAAAYVLLFSLAIPTFVDEAASFYLASDTSLTHMFSALRDGADGSFPLYALLVNGWARIFGSSELSLRLNSGTFVLLFIWHTGSRLQRYFGPAATYLALLFLLANKIFAYYALQARFYGLAICLCSFCFWSTWDLLENQTVSHSRRVRHALLVGLLCLSHPLGLIYAGLLGAVYLAFALMLKRFSLASALAFLGGPAMFLFWLPSFLHQRSVSPQYAAGPAGWFKYWQFAFFDSRILFFSIVAGLAIYVWNRRASMGRKPAASPNTLTEGQIASHHPPDDLLLVGFSLAFIVGLNAIFVLLDAARVLPVYWMQAIRYLLVCWVAYVVVLAAIIAGDWRLLQSFLLARKLRVSGTLPFLAAAVGLLVLIESRWGEWFRARASDMSYFSKVSKIANERHLDVVCKSHWDAFYLATRTPTAHVAYLLEDNYPFKAYLFQASKYYPNPTPICPPDNLHYTNDYMFLTDDPREIRILNPSQPQPDQILFSR